MSVISKTDAKKTGAKQKPSGFDPVRRRFLSAVAAAAGRVVLEASGGITLETAAAAAAAGVDAISLGCLTHSAPSVDLSLEILGL